MGDPLLGSVLAPFPRELAAWLLIIDVVILAILIVELIRWLKK